MKILVCVKQIPDMERMGLAEGPDGTAHLHFSDEFGLNRFDEVAVEEAVRIKESQSGVQVHVITVGPKRSAEVLKRPMGMGADEAIHLWTDGDADPGPAAVAAWIAAYARPEGYDLILCGMMSEDGMHGQVGAMLASRLDLPYATQVIALKPATEPLELFIEREIEAGRREMLIISRPALLALQPGINRPRYPSLSKLLRAHKHPIKTISAEALGPAETPLDCLGFIAPPRMRASHTLTGSAREKAGQLAAILKQKALI